jgi:hypothetical protein
MALENGSGIDIWNIKTPFTNFYDLYPGNPQPVAEILLSWIDLFPYCTFVPIAGETYQIQLRCIPEASFTFVFVSTNTPVIMEQPRTQTVSEDGHALFTVHAGGLKPLGYQWQFEGHDLPGQKAAMLALTNVTLVQAGNYSVVVTNAGGATTSQVARLIVDQINIGPSLGVLSLVSNRIELALDGQEGRCYRIESSTDLLNWTAEKSFWWRSQPSSIWGDLTSVILATNTTTRFTITNTVPRKFLRAVRYAPANELCNLNLKRIRFATEAWCRDVQCLVGFATPSTVELFQYYAEWPALSWPITRCPLGGVYTAMDGTTLPTCSYGHILEEPR